MAQVISLGRVNCGASPVQISALRQKCSQIIVAPVLGMTGKLYFGTSAINKTTLAGVIREFSPASFDHFKLEAQESSNQFTLSDFWIDGAVSGEGLIIAYVVS